MSERHLQPFAILSVGAAVCTIALKMAAWWLTDSVGLLSDALESLVNLVAALATLWMLALAARPADEEHAYGYSKAEYFASGFEGCMVLAAALAIAWSSLERLLHPRQLESIGVGLGASLVASLINLAVARVLARAARRHRSIALEADARHLMTDVWTSAGVIMGLAVVHVTGWSWADPLIALAVAGNIVVTGVSLVRRSALGLLDAAIAPETRTRIEGILARYREEGAEYHALRTRAAAGRSFVSVHVLVPGNWTVKRGHDLVERIECELVEAIAGCVVFTHLEPQGDPTSYLDAELERSRGAQ